MENKYTIGRVNTSATIFVPYDCHNNCNFCTTKSMYKNVNKCEYNNTLKKIKENVKLLSSYGMTIFVLTGGEPFADVDKCKQIIEIIRNASYFPKQLQIFVNTSLPKNKDKKKLIDFINSGLINGISVSRHRNAYEEDCQLLKNIYDDSIFNEINKIPVRVNCILNDNIDIQSFVNRFSQYENILVNFRADYTKITTETLHQKDKYFYQLRDLYQDYQHTECNVCDTDVFVDEVNNKLICYHKGVNNTKVKIDNTIEINDFVIDMFGNAYIDWEFSNENKLTENIMQSIIQTLTEKR